MIRAVASTRTLRRAAQCALVLSLLYTLSVNGTASAATSQPGPVGNSVNTVPASSLGKFKVSYTKHWTFKTKPLGICVLFTVSGNFTYSVSAQPAGVHGYAYTWSNQHLNDSTLTADIRAYDRGACKGRATATNMDMGQDWTGYSCSFNPSISVSIPWAISFGFWPSCGNRTQAEHHHFYPGKYPDYIQYNTGDRASFGNYTSVIVATQKPTPPCYGVYVEGTPYEHNKSDSYAGGSQQVCLKKY
jgi:hypothetical protein